jgi:hypothetical protein
VLFVPGIWIIFSQILPLLPVYDAYEERLEAIIYC